MIRKRPAKKKKTDSEPVLDPLLPMLELAMIRSKLTTTAFCYKHFGDAGFMLKARRGRQFRKATLVEKITAVLSEYGLELVE